MLHAIHQQGEDVTSGSRVVCFRCLINVPCEESESLSALQKQGVLGSYCLSRRVYNVREVVDGTHSRPNITSSEEPSPYNINPTQPDAMRTTFGSSMLSFTSKRDSQDSMRPHLLRPLSTVLELCHRYLPLILISDIVYSHVVDLQDQFLIEFESAWDSGQ
jgi:hypothetical protein